MRWGDLVAIGHIEIDGTRYSLEHLKRHSMPVEIPAVGSGPAFSTILEITYSSHCVSEGCKKGERINFDEIGHQYRIIDDGGRDRKFSLERYNLSSRLPEIFADLVSKTCLSTGHRNYLIVEFLADNNERRSYHIFFDVERADRGLTLLVESAYVPSGPFIPSRNRRMRAAVLLAKTLREGRVAI